MEILTQNVKVFKDLKVYLSVLAGLVCWVKTSLRKGDKELKSKSTRNLPVPPSALDAPTLIKFNQQLQFTVKSGGGGGVGGNSTGGGAGGNKESSDLGGNTWLLVELFIRTASLKGT